jgi:hypothetical protein
MITILLVIVAACYGHPWLGLAIGLGLAIVFFCKDDSK